MINEYKYFLKSNIDILVYLSKANLLAPTVLADCLFFIYLNQNANAKRFERRRDYLTKGVMNNWKNLFDQPVDSDIKRYEEIRNLATGQGEDYTTGCLVDYEYIKNHYIQIAANLGRHML